MMKEGDNPPGQAPRSPPRIPPLPIRRLTTDPKETPPRSGPKSGDLKDQPLDFRAAVAAAAPASPGLRPARHERGVSWDQNVAENARYPSSPPTSGALPEQPDLSAPSSYLSSMAAKPGMPPRPPMISKRVTSTAANGYSRRNLNLQSIPDNAFEREAEDVLLRSLEEQNPMHVRSGTGDNILRGVPLDVLLQDSEGNSGAQAPPPPPPRPRLMSNDHSRASRASLIPKPAQIHRRQLTVEEALFGLTAALSAVHADEVNHGILPDSPTHKRMDTASSTDRLGNVADLVFGKRFMKRRPSSGLTSSGLGASMSGGEDVASPTSGKEGDATSPPVSGGARSNWGILKSSMLSTADSHKKTDIPEGEEDAEGEDELEGIDIETGDDNLNGKQVGFDASERKNSTDEESGSGESGHKKYQKRRTRISKALGPFKYLPYADKIKNEWDLFNAFLRPKKATIMTYARYIILYIWLPALAAAALLFHYFENPPTGRMDETSSTFNETQVEETQPVDKIENKASISWWILFICLRQVGIVIIGKCFEAVIVDFFAIQTRAILRAFGPVITLLLVQSKGWPFLASSWGILNFTLTVGDSEFNKHWLYFQDFWGLFNAENPSGDVTNTLWFSRICAIASALGVAVSAKRVAVGVYLGRQTFANYSDKLAKLMNKMLQVSQVAILAQAIYRKYEAEMDKFDNYGMAPRQQQSTRNFSRDNLMSLIQTANDEPGEETASLMGFNQNPDTSAEETGRVINPDDVDPFTGGLGESQRARIADLLGSWEDPGRNNMKNDDISIGTVLQFRRALASMDTPYPFSGSFGLADTREHCVASAQYVYERLMLKNQTVNGRLHFDTMAVLALQRDGELDQEKAKELIRTFRPDRDGGISMVDFVRSIDAIYKELRMLRATVAASSKIDKALESIMNIAFYVIVFCCILAFYGFDPLALFLSLSSIILAFAFMIGSASAKYFEGLLFILVQRPYGIGDRISVANPETDGNGAGSQGWIVADVTLFTTTIYLAGTNERATVANGVLAKSRIINGARSHKAILVLNLKFGLDSELKRLEIFKSAVEKFVKARPREWLALLAIRAGRVEADLGFLEYQVVVQHREAWQNVGPILDSKHAIHCFMLELTKKLDLRYRSPPLPVLLSHGHNGPIKTIDAKYDFESQLDASQDSEILAPTSPKSVGTATNDDEIEGVIKMFNKGAIIDL